MTAARRATAIDIITSTDGDIFIRFYDGAAIYAVAGLTLEAALAVSEALAAKFEALILQRPDDAPVVH
ncbi:hypothetical protein [Brevundimonas sp.]|uniref:hypothetical protein n=1 Tax=Brevundimonas sp. TaxID=1871086 RepID=UPI003D6D90A1